MTETSGRALARFRVILWGLVVVAAIGATLLFVLRPPANPVGPTGNAFAVQATNGQSFTQDDLKGTPSLVFFGYTFCPDVCPTTLAEIASIRDELKLGPERLRIIFASVDPERDTLPALGDYLSGLGTPIIGLSGTPAEVESLKAAFGVFSEKSGDTSSDSYLVDHTASVFLIGADGQFEGTIGFGEDRGSALAKVKRLAGA